MKNIDVELSTPNRWFTALQFGARQIVLVGAFALCAVAAATVWAGEAMVNINTDTPEVLAEGLSGVGLAKAYRIVEHREAHGPFVTVDELLEVKGIGAAIVERNREKVVLD